MNILIVEDDENSRVLLTSVLTASGYAVASAKNGIDAIGKIEENLPGLIISDILMPEMDGYALCRRLKADQKYYQIPFVFYTATYTEPQDKRFALDLGASAFWLKPMEMDQLVLKVKKIIENTPGQKSVEGPLISGETSRLDIDYKQILARKLDKKVRDLDIERQKLNASENRYKRIVEALRDSYYFYTHDAQGLMTYVSPSAAIILGYSEEELLTHFSTFMTDAAVNRNAQHHKQMILKGEKVPAYEIELLHRNGTARLLKVTEEPLYDDDGQVVSVEGIAHDITEEHSLEKRIRKIHKMEALGTLAGGIAHDFNNILFSVLANANMILKRAEDQKNIYDLAQMIETAGKRAQSLTSQILTYLRRNREDKQDVLLQVIIDEVFKLIRPAVSKQIAFELDIEPECGPVFADPSQIHQVVMNLCTNASQAIGGNLGEIRISLKELDIADSEIEIEPGKYIELVVADTGQGISEAHLEKIFDPYFTTKKKGEGTGLGLSMVHGIVTGMDGYVTVKSTPGEGAGFFIYLPRFFPESGTPAE